MYTIVHESTPQHRCSHCGRWSRRERIHDSDDLIEAEHILLHISAVPNHHSDSVPRAAMPRARRSGVPTPTTNSVGNSFFLLEFSLVFVAADPHVFGRYHEEDFDIDCDTAQYYLLAAVSVGLIVAIPIGVPAIFLFLMNRARLKLPGGKVNTTLLGGAKLVPETMDDDQDSYGFLCRDCRPEYWYYEIVCALATIYALVHASAHVMRVLVHIVGNLRAQAHSRWADNCCWKGHHGTKLLGGSLRGCFSYAPHEGISIRAEATQSG
jgi:hypothetical protein